jgi:hypothetical protein
LVKVYLRITWNENLHRKWAAGIYDIIELFEGCGIIGIFGNILRIFEDF